MSRRKIYDAKPLPKGVAMIAMAICSDYSRRKKTLPLVDDEIVAAAYARMNDAVDAAMMLVEEGPVRDAIRDEILTRTGYEYSKVRGIISVGSYYARRRLVLRTVAEKLNLI